MGGEKPLLSLTLLSLIIRFHSCLLLLINHKREKTHKKVLQSFKKGLDAFTPLAVC